MTESSSVHQARTMTVVTKVFLEPGTQVEAGPEQVKRDPPVWNPAKVTEMTAAFLRGQPQALGIAEIIVGLLCVSCGLIGFTDPNQWIQLPLIATVMFVVSGSVAVAARRGTNVELIRATLALHVISALVALAATAFLSCLLATQLMQWQYCPHTSKNCRTMMRLMMSTLGGVWGLGLVLTVFEFCVCVSLCVFSGVALSRRREAQGYTVMRS